MENYVVYAGIVAFILSELMSINPKMKSNSWLQLFYNVIKSIGKKK